MSRDTRGDRTTRPATTPGVFGVIALTTAAAIGGLAILDHAPSLIGAAWVGGVFIAGVRLLDRTCHE